MPKKLIKKAVKAVKKVVKKVVRKKVEVKEEPVLGSAVNVNACKECNGSGRRNADDLCLICFGSGKA